MKKLVLALLISAPAFGAGKLQNVDFATSASILAASGSLSQLLNTSKMWNTVDSELVNTSIARWDASQSALSTSAAVSNQFVTGFTAPNTFTRAQPDFTNLSGQATNAQLQNPSTTVNGQTCTLGSTCTIATGSGTVTAVSVASANGLAGSSSGGATPQLTLSTSITGILKGNGTAISAGVPGTDYEVPLTFSTGLTRTVNTVSVNASQSITNLTNLVANGIVTTSGGNGTLSVTGTTGSGNVVLATSPTIVTPTIASIANLTSNGFVKTSAGNGTLIVSSSPLTVADTTVASQAIASTVIDWSQGSVFTQSNGATSRTFTFANPTSGQTIVVRLTQTSGAVTWPSVKWPGGTTPSVTASGTDVYTFVYDGTNTYGSAVLDMR